MTDGETEGPIKGGRVSRSLRTLRRPLLSNPRLNQFLLFAVNGGLVAVVYSVAVWTFVGLSPNTFVLDVIAAYGVAIGANYAGSRLVFKPVTGPRRHLPRYLTVVVGNFLLTATIAWLLQDLYANRIASAYAPVLITSVPSFLLMRRWVFNDPDGASQSADATATGCAVTSSRHTRSAVVPARTRPPNR